MSAIMDNNDHSQSKSLLDNNNNNNNNNSNISNININTNTNPHQSLSAIIDDQIDQEKKTFVNKISIQEKKQAEIEKIAKELKGDIKNLAQTIQDILDKHHKDYISTFSTFMDTVRKDLKLKLEQMERIEEEKRKINDVHLIKCERDFFRAESIKFNNLNKDLNARIEDMTLRMKILSDEVNNLTIKWKDSEIVNKELVNELEASIQSHKILEKELMHVKDYIKTIEQQSSSSALPKQNNNSSSPNQDIQTEESIRDKYIYTIDKLKSDLKKEKSHSQKVLSELNNILLEKNKLENIFIDCIEETRKSIFNRRLKVNLASGKGRKVNEAQLRFQVSDINTKYDSFLPADKKQILEHFVFNDEVSNAIRDAIFTKPQKERVLSQNSRNILSKIDLPTVDYPANTKIINNNNKDKDKEDGVMTNIIDHTKTTFFKTGRLTVTSFNRPSTNRKLSMPFKQKR